MTTESIYRTAFVILLLALLSMRVYFMIKVRRSGERLMPDKQAVEREGGREVFIFRVVFFLLLLGLLGMYIAGMAWIDAFSFPLANWLRWLGFALGLLCVAFWTWTQIELDTQWSAQLQLTKGHHLVMTGPYAFIRHPLYTAMFGWAISLVLLTANWLFLALAALSIAGTVRRVPQEEQMMIEAFGDEYRAFMQHTGRYFPILRKANKR